MIPFIDLQAQYRSIQEPLESAVLDALRSCNYVLGSSVNEFETAFADFCGAREAVALNSGTSALHLALLASGVGAGDEVVTVSMTFVASVAAIIYSGAKPVLVDVDPDTFTMSVDAFEAAISSRTRAVVPVHLHGRIANVEAICEVAARHGISVIEDAAQAHGAVRGGRSAGTFGSMGCFSFYPGKNLGACGEGGAVVTDSPETAAMLRSLRDWGQEGKYNHVRHGFNYRMDSLQAAALEVKLRYLPKWTEERRRVAALYDEMFASTNVRTPPPGAGDHVYHVYAVRVDDRDRIQKLLTDAGIATGIHYPRPVHLQAAYSELASGSDRFPISEHLAKQFLSLPIFPEMTERQVRAVVDEVSRAVKGD